MVSLASLFEGGTDYPFDMNAKFTLEDVAFLLCRGGWPIAVQAPQDIALANYEELLWWAIYF